jgi:3-oxoacyl-[acyl-carrier-protein] synthase-1
MNEPACYAYAAVTDAVADAGLEVEALHDCRSGMVFGNDSCVGASVAAIDIARENNETHSIGSSHVFRAMNSAVTMNIAAILRVGGASWTVSAACASGAHAIGQAALLIRSGYQDLVVAGGAQELTWEGMAPFDAMDAFSVRTAEPEKASRPFDRERDGLVPSGGAACVILESLEHARARNARVYGFVRGYGFSSDGSGHLTQPNVDGAIRAIRMALDEARVEPGSLDYINAHGTSTRVGDLAEAKAISAVFGAKTPVSSTKSMTGHECWMAGASEAVYTTLMSRGGFIAPNINFERLDEDCPPINVVHETAPATVKLALSNSFGFGGTNAALVLEYGL